MLTTLLYLLAGVGVFFIIVFASLWLSYDYADWKEKQELRAEQRTALAEAEELMKL